MRACEHCSNPDKENWARRCRYHWYRSPEYRRMGFDPPCAIDASDAADRARRLRRRRNVVIWLGAVEFLLIIIAAFLI